jgi:hypothetical protein
MSNDNLSLDAIEAKMTRWTRAGAIINVEDILKKIASSRIHRLVSVRLHHTLRSIQGITSLPELKRDLKIWHKQEIARCLDWFEACDLIKQEVKESPRFRRFGIKMITPVEGCYATLWENILRTAYQSELEYREAESQKNAQFYGGHSSDKQVANADELEKEIDALLMAAQQDEEKNGASPTPDGKS